jgi:hypothetical protein
MGTKLWDKLGTWKGRLGALSGVLTALVAIGGLVWSGTSLLATDKEVQKAFDKVDKKVETYIEQKTLYDAKRSKQQIKFQLLDPGITPAQRTLLEEEKGELEKVIICVQAGREHCEQ